MRLVFDLLDEPEFADGPSAGHRAPGLPARLARAARPILDWARATHAPAAARRPAGQGRLLGPRGRRGAPARLAAAGVRGQGRLRPQLRGADPAAARGAPGRARGDRRRTTCARSRTRSRSTASSAPTTATWSCRCCAGWATTSSTRCPSAASACAPTARSATWSPAWPTSCGACWRTPRTSRSCTSRRAGVGARGAAGRAVKPFANEPILELRRAPRARRLAERAARARRAAAAAGAGRIGGRRLPAADVRVDRSRVRRTASSPSAERGDRGRTPRRGRAPPQARSRRWAARVAPSAREVLVGAAAWLRERRPLLAAVQVRECAKPWGEADADVCEAIDFLEYYAREAVRLERAAPRAAPGAGRAQHDALRAARRRRGHRAVELPAGDPDRA